MSVSQKAVELHAAGGVIPGLSAVKSAMSHATGVQNMQAAHDAFTNSKSPSQNATHWSNGYIPHETHLALSHTKTFPTQPNVNKPGA